MRLAVATVTAASRARVWDVLVDWEQQPQWMLDAKAVEVLTPQRDGVGVTIRCPTNLLGITVDDTMRVEAWEPARYLEIAHLGRIIRGRGAFELADVDGGTRIVWWEDVPTPFGILGEILGTLFVLPVLEQVFHRSLRRLAARAEAVGA